MSSKHATTSNYVNYHEKMHYDVTCVSWRASVFHVDWLVPSVYRTTGSMIGHSEYGLQGRGGRVGRAQVSNYRGPGFNPTGAVSNLRQVRLPHVAFSLNECVYKDLHGKK